MGVVPFVAPPNGGHIKRKKRGIRGPAQVIDLDPLVRRPPDIPPPPTVTARFGQPLDLATTEQLTDIRALKQVLRQALTELDALKTAYGVRAGQGAYAEDQKERWKAYAKRLEKALKMPLWKRFWLWLCRGRSW